VITVLIKRAEEMRKAQKRGEKLYLSSDEITFYDALEINDSAVQVLGEETLKKIAR
jgi:type I restriction enzyme R subunit